MKIKPIENVSQPEEQVDKIIETHHSIINSHIELLILSSGERLQYQIHNKFKDPEGYADHLLFMVYSFRDECELKLGQPPSYSSKVSESGALEIVNDNKSLVEPYSDLVNTAFLNYRGSNPTGCYIKKL